MTRGFDDNGEPVNVVMPVYPDDDPEPEPIDPPADELALRLAGHLLKTTLRQIYDVLREGSPKKTAARAVGIFRHLEIEKRGLREIAEDLDISVGNLSQEVATTRQKMNGLSQRRKSAK